MDAPSRLLKAAGLAPKKSWGQNFLADAGTLGRIAEAARVASGDTVIELGAGLGHLTERLLATGARVIAVERDRDLAALLRRELPAAEVVEANAATVAFRELAGGPSVVVGNLPYHLSSRILFHCLGQRADMHRMVFTLQAEFADRLAAGPGSRTYGTLSVSAQALCRVQRLFTLPAGAFHPVPAVDSAVVLLEPLAVPRVRLAGTSAFEKTVRAAFGQRRKTLQNSLAGAGLTEVPAALAEAGLDGRRRAETLTVEELGRLAEALEKR
ncbi:MAG: 16S rRNA (adenine(1518)-N(6)/adenine(1519)-N(6))-dimethyltransferase RsmA [Myxococcales bacterium]